MTEQSKPMKLIKGAKRKKASSEVTSRVFINFLAGKQIKGTRRFKFGSVTVANNAAEAVDVAANIRAGTEALTRAKSALVTRGVRLKDTPGVPRFSVDARDPSVMIRNLNGEIERGRFENGAFEPTR
jgi:hypothetical protein